MKVIITFDYELFFGKKGGSFDNSILEPTEELLKISDDYGLKYTIFVDAGYLSKLIEYKNISICQKEYDYNRSLLEKLVNEGHHIEIHIHPHWEHTRNVNGDWSFDLTKYRIHDFSNEERERIFKKYVATINKITGLRLSVVRFGGWCIQPFEDLSNIMKKTELKIDSTVFAGGYDKSPTHYYDFTSSPNKTYWNFENDPIKEEKDGCFTEIPISSTYLLPSFYVKYFFLKALKNKKHKGIGDGIPLYKSKLKMVGLLLKGGVSVVSTDGYKASKLTESLKRYNRIYNDNDFFVTIGHLKSCTHFSIKTLEKFIKDNMEHHEFTTYT